MNGTFALLQLKSASGKEVPIDVDGKGSVMLKAEDGDVFSAGEWFKAWYLAVILRKNKELVNLYQTDISKVKPLNEKDHIRIGYLNFQFFYSLGINNTPDMMLFEEMKSVTEKNLKGYYMPDVEEFPYSNYYFNFNRALILKSIIDNKPDEFNKHLYEGLSYHKAFWGQKRGLNRGEAHLCNDADGFISWPLTALASMAYDKGFKLEVESDYIPKFMVEGNWD